MQQNGSNGPAALLGRLARTEQALEAERSKRRHAEQQLAGTRSALVRLQAVVLKQKAAAAVRRTRS
jgi:hypothetical protein